MGEGIIRLVDLSFFIGIFSLSSFLKRYNSRLTCLLLFPCVVVVILHRLFLSLMIQPSPASAVLFIGKAIVLISCGHPKLPDQPGLLNFVVFSPPSSGRAQNIVLSIVTLPASK